MLARNINHPDSFSKRSHAEGVWRKTAALLYLKQPVQAPDVEASWTPPCGDVTGMWRGSDGLKIQQSDTPSENYMNCILNNPCPCRAVMTSVTDKDGNTEIIQTSLLGDLLQMCLVFISLTLTLQKLTDANIHI